MNIFEEKGVNITSIESLGEFGLIDHLTKDIKLKNESSILGIGDDAAVIVFLGGFKPFLSVIESDFRPGDGPA